MDEKIPWRYHSEISWAIQDFFLVQNQPYSNDNHFDRFDKSTTPRRTIHTSGDPSEEDCCRSLSRQRTLTYLSVIKNSSNEFEKTWLWIFLNHFLTSIIHRYKLILKISSKTIEYNISGLLYKFILQPLSKCLEHSFVLR